MVSPTTPSFFLGRYLGRSRRSSPYFMHIIVVIKFTTCVEHIVKYKANCDGSAQGRARDNRNVQDQTRPKNNMNYLNTSMVVFLSHKVIPEEREGSKGNRWFPLQGAYDIRCHSVTPCSRMPSMWALVP